MDDDRRSAGITYFSTRFEDVTDEITPSRGGRRSITGSPVDRDGNADVGASNTIRLGVEYLLIWPKLVWPLRAGFSYDPEPADGGTDDYFCIALGTGISLNVFSFDISYSFRFANDVQRGIPVIRSLEQAQNDVTQQNLLFSMIAYF